MTSTASHEALRQAKDERTAERKKLARERKDAGAKDAYRKRRE